MRYTTGIASLLAIALAACEVTPPPPNGASPLDPPEYFSAWWTTVETCAAATRPMKQVEWYSVPGYTFSDSRGTTVNGLYRNGPDDIFIASERLKDGPTVRHEMLHAILDSRGGTDHPYEYFMRRCRGVVVCTASCRQSSDAPGGYPASTPVVDSSALEIEIDADSIVSRTRYPEGGYIAVTVRARNPRANAVYVRLPKSGYPARRTFEASAFPGPGCFCGVNAFLVDGDSLDGYFTAGETKRYVLDVFLGPDAPLGQWTAQASFANRVVTRPNAFRVTP